MRSSNCTCFIFMSTACASLSLFSLSLSIITSSSIFSICSLCNSFSQPIKRRKWQKFVYCISTCKNYTISENDDMVMMTWNFCMRKQNNEFLLFSTFNWSHRYTSFKTTVFLQLICTITVWQLNVLTALGCKTVSRWPLSIRHRFSDISRYLGLLWNCSFSFAHIDEIAKITVTIFVTSIEIKAVLSPEMSADPLQHHHHSC